MLRRLAIVALSLAQPSQAQLSETVGTPLQRSASERRDDGWRVTIGAAVVASPVWQGSRDMALSIFPDLRIAYKDEIFASIPDGIGWNTVNRNGWKAGPIAKLRFGRDEERGGSPFLITGGSDALVGSGGVASAFELGGFVEKRFGSLRGRVELRQALGGHDGLILDGSVSYQQRLGRTTVSVGPRAAVASKAFMNTYFGIDAQQALRSGLAPYFAGGGLASYGIGASIVHPLERRSALTLFASFDWLGEEARDSSLVRERGQATQLTLGVGYSFRFDL